MTNELITCKEYADLRGITPDAVRNAIKKGHNLPGLKSSPRKIGTDWVFEIDPLYFAKKKV